MVKRLTQEAAPKKSRQIVIVLDARALLAICAMILVLGWADGYRRRGDLMRVEAQNARILELLEGSEITRVYVEKRIVRLSTP